MTADILVESHRIRQDIATAVQRAGVIGFGVHTAEKNLATVTIPYIDDSYFGKIRKAVDNIRQVHGVKIVNYRMKPMPPKLPGAIDVYY